ncbi:MAG: aminopeptidase P N-terminal domain-containing protein [Candidatus Marinimicrobia bacterium]|nr:aminopeptidase P N-terminal domain-containing protein [Candidatus Neomarinimicrobiota bacterium]MCH7955148.1 aminopeptidase P N-terminal domain-containing protein [Candidatus Neomarinimicrobiota bacterium]
MKRFGIITFLALLEFSALFAQYNPYPDKSIFAEKRKQFMEIIGDDAVAIIVANPEYKRNNDVDHDYRQDSDMFYLTGFEEPESIAVLRPGAEKLRYTLFVRKRDKLRETWDGHRFGVKGAMETFGADSAYTIDEFDKMLGGILRGAKTVYHNFGADEELSESILERVSVNAGRSDLSMKNARYELGEMRKIKSDWEVKSLRKAIDITSEAHKEAMKSARPGMGEYEIEAVIEYIYRKHGVQRPGFPSIVAAGSNTTTLHYQTNEMKMKKGDLLLVDIGAEWGYYSADVSRTYPVNGKFSKEQAAIYQIVYDAQEAAFKISRPGTSRKELSDIVRNSVIDGLIKVGLLSGTLEEIIKDRSYKKFYLHGFGHWIGLDVHDPGSYTEDGESVIMRPGMVYTVEPGIYITEDDSVDTKWWNIGVRIEDCVLITEKGYELLSDKSPRKIKKIEKLMRKKGLAQKD